MAVSRQSKSLTLRTPGETDIIQLIYMSRSLLKTHTQKKTLPCDLKDVIRGFNCIIVHVTSLKNLASIVKALYILAC